MRSVLQSDPIRFAVCFHEGNSFLFERSLVEHSQEMAEQISARIRELESDLEAHRRALAVLGGPVRTGQPKTNGQPARAARATGESSTERTVSAPRPPRKRGRRPVVSAEAVFDALADGNDQAAEIAKEFGVSTAAVRLRLAQLEEAGRVSRSGERRGTRWRSHAAS